jgi:hypothetical protein
VAALPRLPIFPPQSGPTFEPVLTRA